MNEHDLLDAIGKTEETVLEASEKRHIPWKFLLTAAACLVLLLSTLLAFLSPGQQTSSPLPGQIISSQRLTWISNNNTLDYFSEGGMAEQGTPPPQFSNNLSVEARVLDVLPDLYQFPSGYRDSQKYHVLRMELLDAIYAEHMPSEFYYLLPAELSTDLKQFDSLIMVVGQAGTEYGLLQNVDSSRLEAFSFLFFSGVFLPHEGAVIACTDGKMDMSLWLLEGWNEISYWPEALSDPEKFPQYPGKRNRTVEEIKEAIRRDIGKYDSWYARPKYVLSNADLDWEEAQAVVEYTKPFENGFFKSFISNGGFAYQRIINGFPTNEYIYVNAENKTISHDVRFTQEDIENAPDLTFHFLFASLRTPPRQKSGKPLVFCTAKGSYEKHGDHVFGIIKIYWGGKTTDLYNPYPVYNGITVFTSSYLLVYPNGKAVKVDRYNELSALIEEYIG